MSRRKPRNPVAIGLVALALLRRHAPTASRTLDGELPLERERDPG
jgi:hypothetical protein